MMKGVIANAKKELKEYRESGQFWHDSVSFDPSLFLDKENKTLAKQLFLSLNVKGYKLGEKDQKQEDFEILIANLLDQTKKPVSISRNRNSWKTSKYNPVSYFVIELMDMLVDNKLITMKIGYKTEKESSMTRIQATEKLLAAFPEYHNGVRYKPVQLVEVRDNKKKLIDYPETKEVQRIRGILEKANKINNEANIMHVADHKCLRLNTSLVAIFTNKLTLGGRLYARGISRFQALSSEERQDITINNNPTVELDFKGLHPFLLYAAEGIQYWSDPYLTVESNPIARPFMKTILLCMLNAKDDKTAEKAAQNWLYENHSERESLKEIGITRPRPLIDKFREVHKPISHYFCKGKESGQRIINKDSKIALDVINHFVKQGIPILGIHDSFIVEEQYAKELEKVMKTTYRDHTGFRCIVK